MILIHPPPRVLRDWMRQASEGSSQMNTQRFVRAVFVAAMFTVATSVHAAVAMAALPPGNVGAAFGKSVSGKDCVDCATRRIGGEAARIYFRGERRVRAPEQLLAQVSYCSPELGAGAFPDDEEHIAAYLNKQYYRFK
jgi:hypothetical protein